MKHTNVDRLTKVTALTPYRYILCGFALIICVSAAIADDEKGSLEQVETSRTLALDQLCIDDAVGGCANIEIPQAAHTAARAALIPEQVDSKSSPPIAKRKLKIKSAQATEEEVLADIRQRQLEAIRGYSDGILLLAEALAAQNQSRTLPAGIEAANENLSPRSPNKQIAAYTFLLRSVQQALPTSVVNGLQTLLGL